MKGYEKKLRKNKASRDRPGKSFSFSKWEALRRFGSGYGRLWSRSENLGVVTEDFDVVPKIWESTRNTLMSFRKFGSGYGGLWSRSENLGVVPEDFDVVLKIWESSRRTLTSFRKFGSRYGGL
jgi:hypothetical protein